MPTANEIVRRKKKAELEELKQEFDKKPKGTLMKILAEAEEKLQEVINCDGCKRRRAKIKKQIARLKRYLGIDEGSD